MCVVDAKGVYMTNKDLDAIDRLIRPPGPPERIYHWLDSQLSIARFYGGCRYMGHDYVIEFGKPGDPLVRLDVLAAEKDAIKAASKAKRDADKLAAKEKQGDLL